MEQLGLRGASIGGHVNGEDLSSPKYDPFWAKAAELGALVFMHPGDQLIYHAVSTVVVDAFRKIGINIDEQVIDWGTVIQRRTSKEPVAR